MGDTNQSQGGAVTLVGMDAHARVLSLCVAEWRHGSDPKVGRNIPNVLLEDMEKVYERWIPKDALTLVDSQLEDFEYFCRKRAADALRIKKLAIRRKDVLRLMQLPGIKLYIAFAIVVFIEDIRRFPTAKCLVSYFGLNPAVNASGEQERRQKRKGKGHDHLSKFGRSFVKAVSAEVYAHLPERPSELQT